MIQEYTQTTFDDFRKNLRNTIKLYHCTTKEGAEGIIKNGTSIEYTGKNSNFYGQGFYTTYDLNSTLDNQKGNTYGKYLIEFALIDGFKNFIIFDKAMNDRYNGGKPVEEQIKELCPPEIVTKLKNRGYFRFVDQTYGKTWRSAPMARAFFVALRGNPLNKDNMAPWQQSSLWGGLSDESELAKTKVRGYVFWGGSDGKVCVVRDFSSLIPIKIWDPTKGKDPRNVRDSGWIGVLEQSTYNNITSNGTSGIEIRGMYPETPLNEKVICGYMLVKGKPAGKYNYVNMSTKKELLPVPANYATAFDPASETAKFTIGDSDYEYSAKNNVFIEDGCFVYSPEEFAAELKENGLLQESFNKMITLMKKIM